VVHGGSDGNNFLFAGDGAATLFGGGSGDQLFAYGGHRQTLIAGAGNETLSGAFGWGNNKFVAGSGHDTMIGGSGHDTFVGGRGHADVLATNPGKDVFEFIKGEAGGKMVVDGITNAADVHIDLDGYGRREVQHALGSQTSNGSSVTVSLSDGTRITFDSITHLNVSNFS
jgi:Ca2+-binding RTX toxin-like protein